MKKRYFCQNCLQYHPEASKPNAYEQQPHNYLR